MSVVQKMLDTFINRTLDYHYPHHIGMVTYSTVARVDIILSDKIEYLHPSVSYDDGKDVNCLLKAVTTAKEQLLFYEAEHPYTKKRIVVFTDFDYEKLEERPDPQGTAQALCLALQVYLRGIVSNGKQADITVDSFVIGPEYKYQCEMTAICDAYNNL
jgi:hypothetical protein